MLALVGVFLALGWWQIGRAAAGSTLSLAYAVEWPLFAVFVIAIWVRELRFELRGPAPAARPPSVLRSKPVLVPDRGAPTSVDEASGEDPALDAYNDYLAWIAADPARRPHDYRPGE